jgi:hypothetical protein
MQAAASLTAPSPSSESPGVPPPVGKSLKAKQSCRQAAQHTRKESPAKTIQLQAVGRPIIPNTEKLLRKRCVRDMCVCVCVCVFCAVQRETGASWYYYYGFNVFESGIIRVC